MEHYASLAAEYEYDGSRSCGLCARVQGEAESVIVMITDACGRNADDGCTEGHITLSPAAWQAIGGGEADGDVENLCGDWEFVECPDEFFESDDTMKVRLMQNANEWWQALQPVNHKSKVKKVEIGDRTLEIFDEVPDDDNEPENKRGFWFENQYLDGEGQLELPAIVRVTMEGGECAEGTMDSMQGEFILDQDCSEDTPEETSQEETSEEGQFLIVETAICTQQKAQ